MGDIDERVGRSGSQPRFHAPEMQPQPDAFAKLISDYEYTAAVSDRDLLDLLRKLEKSGPERCTKAPKFVAQLFNHKNAAVRKSAFACGLAILSHPQNPRQSLLDSYRLAMCSSNYQVAQYAISLLPDFVDMCPEEANNLIKYGSIAYRKLPAPSSEAEMHLSRALTKASQ